MVVRCSVSITIFVSLCVSTLDTSGSSSCEIDGAEIDLRIDFLGTYCIQL